MPHNVDMSQMVLQIMNPDNMVRGMAEKYLIEMQEDSPEKYVNALLDCIANQQASSDEFGMIQQLIWFLIQKCLSKHVRDIAKDTLEAIIKYASTSDFSQSKAKRDLCLNIINGVMKKSKDEIIKEKK